MDTRKKNKAFLETLGYTTFLGEQDWLFIPDPVKKVVGKSHARFQIKRNPGHDNMGKDTILTLSLSSDADEEGFVCEKSIKLVNPTNIEIEKALKFLGR